VGLLNIKLTMKNKWVLPSSLAAVFLVLISFVPPAKKITIYLIGDSTLAIKQTKAYPETGWGMPFVHFFDQQVSIENRAQNGRSTKTFVSENRWQAVMDSLKKGDYVFIQFGHNDEVIQKATYTPIEAYEAYLLKFIVETRSKQAFPVLLTPVSRRQFDASGKVRETHPGYSNSVRSIAQQQKVPLIDADQKSMALYQKLGPEGSKLLFNHLEPGVNPNYPDGKIDNTHFNELGAREIAQIVLQEIRNLHLDLVNHIIKPPVKNNNK